MQLKAAAAQPQQQLPQPAAALLSALAGAPGQTHAMTQRLAQASGSTAGLHAALSAGRGTAAVGGVGVGATRMVLGGPAAGMGALAGAKHAQDLASAAALCVSIRCREIYVFVS